MSKYDALETTKISQKNTLSHPAHLPEVVHLDDPAMAVMLDFQRKKPLTIGPDEPITNAINEMKVSGVHMLLVLNEHGEMIGVIDTEDLMGEKPIKIMQQRSMERGDLLVKMVMTQHKEILALSVDVLKHAKVGNIVKTLTEHHSHYALVVADQTETEQQLIRGLFSSSQISRQLHRDISNKIDQKF